MKKLTILGSTGSIGTQALEVVEDLKGIKDIEVKAISGNSNIKLLEEQIRKFKPKYAAVSDEKKAKELEIAVKDVDCKILSGEECETVISPQKNVSTYAALPTEQS